MRFLHVRFSERNKKALSTVIGMIIVLIIMMAVLIPFSFLLFSVPSAQSMASQNAQVASSLASAQDNEVVVIQSSEQLSTVDLESSNQPIYFGLVYLPSGELYILLLQNVTPSVPLKIKDILGFEGNSWKVLKKGLDLTVSQNTADSSFAGHPAVKIQLPALQKVAIVTNYGNMIPVTPYNYISPVLTKKTGGVVYLDPNSLDVLQNPQALFLPYSFFNASENTQPLSELVNKYGNSLTLSGVIVGGSNEEFNFNGYYEGPMCAELPSEPLASPNPFNFEGTFSGYWALPSCDVLSGDASYDGTITLAPSFSGSPGNVTIDGNVSNLVVSGAEAHFHDFKGQVVFSNGSKLTVNQTISSLNLTSTATVTGSGEVIFKDGYEICYGLFKNYFTANLNGVMEGKIIVSDDVTGFNYHVYGKGTFNGKFQIQSFGLQDAGFAEFQGKVDGSLTNVQVDCFNSLTIDMFAQPRGVKVTSLGLLSFIETPIKIKFNFAVSNPSNSTLDIYYAYIFLNEKFVFRLPASSGVPAGSTQGCFDGYARVDFPSKIEVPPGGFVNQTITVSIPLQLQLFGNPQLSQKDNISILKSSEFEPVYETMNFELYSNIGYLTSGSFVIPIQVPVQVQAQSS